MKGSLVVTILILVVGSWYGVQDTMRVIHLKKERDLLAREAALLGLEVDLSHPDLGIPRLGEREVREEKAKEVAAELIKFALVMKAAEESGEEMGEDQQAKIYELMGDLLDLDPSQLEVLIAELKASPDLDKERYGQVVGFAVMMLANDHPEAALTLFTESEDLDGMGRMKEHVVSSALTRWATEDPLAALEWIRANEKEHADLVTDDTRHAVLAGAAKQDPRLAFSLIGELGMEVSGSVISPMVSALTSSDERLAFLAAARAHAASQGDEGARAEELSSTIHGLASGVSNGGFEAASDWLERAKLSEEELVDFAKGVQPWQVQEETAKWLEWMSESVEVSQVEGSIKNLVRSWTNKDFHAAGEWLNGAEEGPAKEVAVKAYAETVAPYEPDSAALWAVTLPDGEVRERLVADIYSQWKGKDAAAAAAFAAEQGIEVEEEPGE